MKAAHLEELTASLCALRTRAEALLHSFASDTDEKLDAAGQRARDSLRRVREHLCAAEKELSSKAHAVDRVVRDHPWRAVAATGIVAFLLGLLVRRR